MSLLNLLDDYQVKNSLLNSIELTSRCLQDFLIHYRLLIPSIYIQQESGKQINFITLPAHKISLTTPLKNQAVKQATTITNNRFYTPSRLKLIFDFVYLRITKVSLGKTYSADKSCLTGYRQNTPFLVKNKVDKSSLKITRKQAVNAAIKGLQAKCGFGNPSTYVNLNQTLGLSYYVKQNIAKAFALATLFYLDDCNSKNSRLNAVSIAGQYLHRFLLNYVYLIPSKYVQVNHASQLPSYVDKVNHRTLKKQVLNVDSNGMEAKLDSGNPSTYVNVDRQHFKILGWPAYKACLTGLVKNPLAKLIKSLTTIGHNVLFWSKQKSSFVLLRPAKISLRLLLASGLGSGYDDCVHPHGELALTGYQSNGTQSAPIAAFLCVSFGIRLPMVKLERDTFACAGIRLNQSVNPFQLCHPHMTVNGKASLKSNGAHTCA